MFTNFLYNDLWGVCEKTIEQIDQSEDISLKTKAVLAAYNIAFYCGKKAIDDNAKIDVESFIKNQFSEDPAISCPTILIQLFHAAENFLVDIKGEALLGNFEIMKKRTMAFMGIREEHLVVETYLK